MPKVVLRALAIALAGCVAVVALAYGLLQLFPSGEGPISDPIDFVAFHSAGRVALTHADPYLAEPLRSVERDALAESRVKIVPNLVVPAPLPPYELALFAVLGLLKFRIASALWMAGAFLAIGATIVMIRRLSAAPLWLVTVVVFLADGMSSMLIGQIVPYMVCALCASALSLQDDRPKRAALFATALMAEPHVGISVLLALFAWERRSRSTIVCVAAVLAALTLAAGVDRSLEYVRVVLPLQARGEGLEFGGQYSLSALLAAYGVPAGLALAFGTLSYLAMLAGSVVVTPRLAAALRAPAVLVLLPPACVIVGGSYIHIHQIAFALPLAFLLLGRRGVARTCALAAIICLSVPWEMLGEIRGVGPNHPAIRHTTTGADLQRVSSGTLPAEIAWTVWVRSGERDSRTREERLAFKLPTWFGLGLMLAGVGAACGRRAKPSLTTTFA